MSASGGRGTDLNAAAVRLGQAIAQSVLEVARRNAQRHGVIDRVSLRQSDLLVAAGAAEFDVVLSNPPYVAEGEVLEPQVANYEPHSALYAGPSGLEIYERLIAGAPRVLRPGGHLILELGYNSSDRVLELLDANFENIRLTADLAGIPRVVSCQLPH